MTTAQPSFDPLISLLAQERTRFLAEVARVPAPLQSQHLVPGAWSVVEVIEHVTRVDLGVGKMFAMARAGKLPAGVSSPVTSAPLPTAIVAKVRDRTLRLEAPERVRPTGQLTSEAALQGLEQARAALIEAYRTATPEELDHAAFPHPFFGPLTLRAWVELSSHHDARHAQQLAELATAAGVR